MVDFSRPDEAKQWLDGIEPAERRREIAIALAARAALRVLPFVGYALRPSESKRVSIPKARVFREVVLPSFGATALAWIAGQQPIGASELLANCAPVVARRAEDAIGAILSAPRSASLATTAAAFAADTVHVFEKSGRAAQTFDSALEAVNAHWPTLAQTALAAIEMTAGLEADATAVSSGRSATELARTPLWPNGAPRWATEAWRTLKSDLLAANQDWEVWTEWYEARLIGDAANPPNEALEIARATIPDEIWKQGPAAVNAEIKRLIDEHEKGELVVDDPRASIAMADDSEHDKAAFAPPFAPILATRSALRALPLIVIHESRLNDMTRLVDVVTLRGRTKSLHVLAAFRALAIAWSSVRYPDAVNRQWCVAAGRQVGVSGWRSELERHIAKSAAGAAFSAGSETSGAATAQAASARIEAQHAIGIASDRAAQAAARLADSIDVNDVVADVSPGQVAEIALWTGQDPPLFLRERWNALKRSLAAADEGWEVWIDWYEARLNGRIQPKEVELAYVEFIRNVVDSAPVRVANAEIKRLIDLHKPNPFPPTPATEPGSILEVGEQGLALATPPSLGDFDHSLQSALHERLKRLCPSLVEATRRVGNTHPGLKTIVDEYADLVARPMDAIDAASLWTVGVGLLANRDAFARLPRAGVMTEPLEPDHFALLEQVAAIHGAFILGLPQGRELTERADQGRLTPEILAAILPPSRDLLERWRDAGQIVEGRTRTFFGAVRAAAIEPSWRTARVGYSVYVVTRNALIGVGKLLLIANSVGGTLVAGAALTGVDPTLVEQTRLWIQFVLDHAQTILSFSEPFPELKTWLAAIIDELARDSAFRKK